MSEVAASFASQATAPRPFAPHVFARRLILWHARCGRHDLPWQRERTPYRVWISEVMLQQTQVATVIPYFERFVARFPSVHALAAAPLDEVLQLWAGLGYYARARHLHRAAVRIRDEFGGVLPQDPTTLAALPGIGRSTAAAILALSRGKRCAILDGNVRRVLARCFGVEGDPARPATLGQLWALAERCTPRAQVDTYTQAIMDLGATLCTRRNPRCGECPLAARCVARALGRQHELPAPRARRPRPARHAYLLLALRADGRVLLTRRPARGIWGALWCPPQFETRAEASAFARSELRACAEPEALAPIEHAFTHFHLTITPLLARCAAAAEVREGDGALWYRSGESAVGLPAPVHTLLERVACQRRTLS